MNALFFSFPERFSLHLLKGARSLFDPPIPPQHELHPPCISWPVCSDLPVREPC